MEPIANLPAALCALLVGLAMASRAAASDPPTQPPPAAWLATPTIEQELAAYPGKALQLAEPGVVTLKCAIAVSGDLRDCTVLNEDPADQGFRDAALSLIPYFRAPPPAAEASVVFRIRFQPSASPPPAAPPQLASTPPPPAVVGAPAARSPADACSAEAIDAQDPLIPEDGPDPDLSPGDRAQLATHYSRRAALYMRCNDLPAALQNDKVAAALDPNNIMVIAAYARVYLAQKDYDKATQLYTQALSLNSEADPAPITRSIYANRAYAYAQLSRYREAIADLDKVLDELKDLPSIGLASLSLYRQRRAYAYFYAGDFAQAQAAFAAAIAAGDTDWGNYYGLGLAERRSGDIDGAISALTSAVAELPRALGGDPLSRQRTAVELFLAQTYVARGRTGDLQAAKDAYGAALADDPASAEARTGLNALSGGTAQAN